MLQSILAAHGQIATAPEPWFLLTLAALTGDTRAYGRYNVSLARRAFADLERHANERGGSMDAAIRSFTTTAYSQFAEPGHRWFIDKTPRYAAISPFLARVFPEARFIVLWRDPRDVISSIIKTWGGGRWNVFLYEYDLARGAQGLTEIADDPRTLAIRYEDLVADPQPVLASIAAFLELDGPIQPSVNRVPGDMGDPTGHRYGDKISDESVGDWRDMFQGQLRRRWMRRYLLDHFPAAAPYDRLGLADELTKTPARALDDIFDLALVPVTRMWPTMNRASGYQLEEALRTSFNRVGRRRIERETM